MTKSGFGEKAGRRVRERTKTGIWKTSKKKRTKTRYWEKRNGTNKNEKRKKGQKKKIGKIERRKKIRGNWTRKKKEIDFKPSRTTRTL